MRFYYREFFFQFKSAENQNVMKAVIEALIQSAGGKKDHFEELTSKLKFERTQINQMTWREWEQGRDVLQIKEHVENSKTERKKNKKETEKRLMGARN